MSEDLRARLQTVLSLDPAAPAIESDGVWTDWAALRSIADGVEHHLAAAGLGAGSPVGLVLRNHPAMVGALIGVLLTGATVVTLNAAHGDAGLSADIADLNLAAVIAVESDWQRDGVRDAAAGALGLRVTAAPPEVTVQDGLEAPGPGPFRSEPDGVAVEMLTSGTTGPPKRIPLTYRAFERTVAAASAHYSASTDQRPRLSSGVAIVAAPLVHMSGMFRTLLNICQGRRIALLERFTVADFVGAVQRHRPRAVSLVPSAMAMVLDADVAPEVFDTVEVVTSGTAHLPVAVQEAFEERYDVAVLPSYGATEFAGGVAGWNLALHRQWAEAKRGSVGRPQRGREVRIMSVDKDVEVGANVQGRIEVRTGDGDWVPTTDLGRIDADGFLYVEGRTDDVIIRGGFKVAPADIVDALRTHPGVRDAGVTGLPDRRLGAVPVAAVEATAGADVDPEQLLDFLRERLTRYQVPSRIIVVDELPRTPSLKVSQPGLRELFSSREEVQA
ncbi:class I adenylate-forming enzyme family protein [Mycobacterium sp. SMC-4]|uniref:class I adenylate-forming enzyme family protein n=1 Tax=Mycobacterium sp. SMC-4 TaxID=2857059 RepID=UPI0021B23B82|nr:fatty acid--CoA ligase family protein [Mycobacterium sp. SMC-4]UXA19228.1 fatty acid--CoA ligase family protein [Mycobacterium sp. SMC-4]